MNQYTGTHALLLRRLGQGMAPRPELAGDWSRMSV
jgi:hypothetical protein